MHESPEILTVDTKRQKNVSGTIFKSGCKNITFFKMKISFLSFYYNLPTSFSISSHPCTHLLDNTKQIYKIIITLNFQCIE
ncbi:MAG TPA: hypothetical protein DER55_03000 [Bacteroides uniformis]|uniref:Uncharacterized protein n=2 Tax=Bacteroides uniformis TaxID=820 RepID=A0A414BN88_BACUN|nr:hypothetical protein GAQ73_09275 [Bacteroides uniformis]RGD51930.1 hypothetical protein DW096_17870 [Bacteroides sp. AM07-18]RJU26128.1 hypothetical protein DW995_16940 [Bacteroides sp. AM51-7]RJU36179.1 hypothetical protein DW947_04640 [Bacteroides sp. AM44-19]RJU53107.1 hypothetical protein DW777_15955 [Bacteroides sp. AM30-16]RJU72041.1 hypothetical protein DW699_17325 [Bacteroides sp. AM26-2]RJV14148.1 hypothetical protein DWY74_14330 [Bacteroides sp. AF27-10BH]RJW87474.1 hypothetical